MAFPLLNRFRRKADPRDALRPLYATLIDAARAPHWYVEGAVADTMDGRFGAVALCVSLAILRLEELGDEGRQASVMLTELFVEDMEGQIREMGIGDVVVGKHVGRMMGLLGGQVGALRVALAPNGDLPAALQRNLYAGEAVAEQALGHSAARARELAAQLGATPFGGLIAGQIG